MPKVTTRPRQDYLGKREITQFELLKPQIQDEETNFRGEVMSEHEIRELNKKQDALRLAQERMAIDDGYNGYMILEGINFVPFLLFQVPVYE
ncbi:hypothetical protein O181_131273 [Austropuccinia psidii MF-1]|uniref:Uncharacterized protein n=1 Tax=Austropuccinia psidii MF-1 TaxID=1389203 RepID=A0A9Q3QAJ9_9BASI|nr:hypothetical protein [Austropuccinia psidii MF-1]